MILRSMADTLALEESRSPTWFKRGYVLTSLARAYLAADDELGAADAYRQAIDLYDESGQHTYAGAVRGKWAKHLEEVGRIDQARELYDEEVSSVEARPGGANLDCLRSYVQFLGRHGPQSELPRVENAIERAAALAPRVVEKPDGSSEVIWGEER